MQHICNIKYTFYGHVKDTWDYYYLIIHKFKMQILLILTGRKEGNVLFNDALNTFYLQLYGVTHMVKDHSDSEREETCCRHIGYSF